MLALKVSGRPGMAVPMIILALGRQRKEDREFQASLSHCLNQKPEASEMALAA